MLPGSIVEITGSECAFLLSISFPFKSSSSSLSVLIANRIVSRPVNNSYYYIYLSFLIKNQIKQQMK